MAARAKAQDWLLTEQPKKWLQESRVRGRGNILRTEGRRGDGRGDILSEMRPRDGRDICINIYTHIYMYMCVCVCIHACVSVS